MLIVLETYKNTLIGKGILQAYDNCSIYSYDGPGEGKAIINNELFEAGNIDCSEYIGKHIEFYYTYEDGEYILKYIMPAYNEIKVLNHDDELSYASGVYYYRDAGNKMRTVSISDKTIYMYNGKKAETIDDFTPACGTVTLIDNNNDGKIDILSIIDKKLVVVIEDNVAKLMDRSAFAGSVATSDRLVRNMVTLADCSLCDAVKMMTVVPANILKVDNRKGKIAKGYDADIIISYHTVKNIEMSFSYKDIKGDNYKDVISKLENEGFVNIRAEVLYDVVTGWVTDDGEVEYVSIDGDKKFKIGEEFRPDVEVVVAFHTYKKNAK